MKTLIQFKLAFALLLMPLTVFGNNISPEITKSTKEKQIQKRNPTTYSITELFLYWQLF